LEKQFKYGKVSLACLGGIVHQAKTQGVPWEYIAYTLQPKSVEMPGNN